jgi:ABC-2 type transport system permease protein
MPRSAIALLAHQLRFDVLAFRRNRQASLSTIAMPVLLLVVLVTAATGETAGYEGRQVSLAQYLAPGLAAFGVVCAAFLTLVVDVVVQRESGILKRRRATPVPAWVLIGGRVLTAAVAALAVTFVLLVIAGNAYGVAVPTAGLPALAVCVVVGALAFASLGYAASTVIGSAAAAQPVASLLVLPMLVVSSVLVPGGDLPGWLDALAQVLPLQPLADAMRHAIDPAGAGAHLAVRDLLILSAWCVGGFVVAQRRFAWTARSGR